MYYLSFTRNSPRKGYHNANNLVKPIPSLIVYVLYFHFLPNKQLLVKSGKKKDIRNNDKDHVKVILGSFFLACLQGIFLIFIKVTVFLSTRKKSVFFSLS